MPIVRLISRPYDSGTSYVWFSTEPGMSRSLVVLALMLLLLPGCGGGCSSETQVDEIVPSEKPAAVDPPKFADEDWPWWRGIQRDGITRDNAKYPTEWSKTKNVVWKARIPGHGLSSPIVVGERVFVTTAEVGSQVQSVLCYNRKTGDLQWRQDVHQGKLGDVGHPDSTHATATLACDGERLFAVFKNDGKIFVTGLSVEGKQLWQTEVGRHEADHGFGTSPLIYQELVILAVDSKKYGFIAGLHRESGKIHWRRKRPATDSYATPVVAPINGDDHLLLSGGKKVVSYEPLTGKTKWSIDAGTDTMCGTITWEGDMIFVSGGYPTPGTYGIKVSSESAETVWENGHKSYVPSLLVHNGLVYLNDFSGGGPLSILYCFDAKTGKQRWKTRISRGCYGSPTLAGGHIYIPERNGKVTVIKPNGDRAEKVALNTLGDAMDTTPTACGGRLYMRVVDHSDGKTGWLYCIGEK